MLRERRRAANFKPNRKLDRKSSRGMIYENEELRLRTTNIHAEVEQGERDIRKLRNENAQLRREIWALRDEYDRLDKLLTAHRKGSRTVTNSSNENSDNMNSSDGESYSDDNISCETCQGLIIDDCETTDNTKNNQKSLTNCATTTPTTTTMTSSLTPPSTSSSKKENLHVNFDHLSIVSEESNPNSPIDFGFLESPSIMATLSPLTELQSVWPPLKHFENISYENLGPSVDADGQILQNNPPSKSIPVTEPIRLCPPPLKPKPTIFAPLRLKIPERKDTMYATVSRNPHMRLHVPQSPQSPSTFPKGGNLDDLLKDLSLPETPTIASPSRKPDIIVIQSEDDNMAAPIPEMTPRTIRKHRSEISVVLDYTEKNQNTAKIGFEQFLPETTEILNPLDTPTIEVLEEVLPPPPPSFDTNSINLPPNSTVTGEKRLSPVVDLKRKTRRVSLSFGNPMKKTENRRASIDVVTPSTETVAPVLRRHNSHNNNNSNSNHQHGQKISHDSLKIPGTKGKRRSMDESGVTENGNEKSGGHESNHHHHHHHRRSLSRESSASVATQKSRKVSISSQGGSIPWCGCWGNGCF